MAQIRSLPVAGLVPVLLDVAVPTVGYFALHAAGLPDVWALTLAGSATAIVAAGHSVRARRVDLLGLLIVAELAIAIVLAASTDDPRLVLVRPALYLAVAGAVNVVAALRGRPLTYEAAFPMATKGDPDRIAAYGRVWERSADFRRIHRRLALALGCGFLAYAAIRVLAVYELSIGEALIAQELPGLLLLVGALALVRSQVPALRRIVDEEQRRVAS